MKQTRRAQRHNELQTSIRRVRQFFAFKLGMLIIFILLLSANIFVFAESVRLSDELVDLEEKISELQKENSRYEQKLITQNSLTNLEELADQLGFTKSMEPVVLDVNEYALIR